MKTSVYSKSLNTFCGALFLVLLIFMAPFVSMAQQIPGAPAYRLPTTVTTQKWFGSGPPNTGATAYPSQPGDTYTDTVTGFIYQCAAPISSLAPLTGGPPSCSQIKDAGWVLLNVIQGVSVPFTLSQLQTLNSIPVQVIPAKGAGLAIEITSCWLNLTRGSAAFTGGGTVTIGYGTTAATAAAATIAATVFTTFASSHAIVVAGALPVTASTTLANAPIYITAAGDFAAGTGATGQLDCSYRVHANTL